MAKIINNNFTSEKYKVLKLRYVFLSISSFVNLVMTLFKRLKSIQKNENLAEDKSSFLIL